MRRANFVDHYFYVEHGSFGFDSLFVRTDWSHAG